MASMTITQRNETFKPASLLRTVGDLLRLKQRRSHKVFIEVSDGDSDFHVFRDEHSFTLREGGAIALIGDKHIMPDGSVCVNVIYPGDCGADLA